MKIKIKNKKMDVDAFDIQEIKRVRQSLCFDIFYSLILAADIAIYLSFAIINDNLLKQAVVTAKHFQ